MASAIVLPRCETSLERASLRTRLRAVDLRGPAGRIEALLNEGASDSPVAALVCHPHPLGGGTMHNKVVYHAAKVMSAPEWGLCWPVLRFNFRGTGRSEGRHDGTAEAADVAAAVDWLRSEYGVPVVIAGFSFGAATALAATCGNRSDVCALAALGLPIQGFGRTYSYPFVSRCTLPKLFLSGDRDRFAPLRELQQVVESAAHPRKLVLIPAADHFFNGCLPMMQQALATWLKEQLQ
jgi:alpha/beta superfamily hydrolase